MSLNHDRERIARELAAKAAKPRVDLYPPEALLGTLPAIEYGASKYAPRAWESGLDYSSLYAAALRHLFAWWSGEDVDAESGNAHLSHAAACIAFLLTFEARGVGSDDRPKPAEPAFAPALLELPEPVAPEAALPLDEYREPTDVFRIGDAIRTVGGIYPAGLLGRVVYVGDLYVHVETPGFRIAYLDVLPGEIELVEAGS